MIAPDASLAELEPWIAGRLRPLADGDGDGDGPDATVRSDHDLDPLSLRPRLAAPSPAAVLVGLVERAAGLTVLLTRRADTLTNHSGQTAFPGGRCDPGERPWETALREAEEEIGLDRAFVRLAGLGDAYETITGFRVIPVVGFVREGFILTPSPAEVADVFEVPFAFLMNPANHERRIQAYQGRDRHYYAMPHQDRLIWGATAGMLRGLYERVFGAG